MPHVFPVFSEPLGVGAVYHEVVYHVEEVPHRRLGDSAELGYPGRDECPLHGAWSIGDNPVPNLVPRLAEEEVFTFCNVLRGYRHRPPGEARRLSRPYLKVEDDPLIGEDLLEDLLRVEILFGRFSRHASTSFPSTEALRRAPSSYRASPRIGCTPQHPYLLSA